MKTMYVALAGVVFVGAAIAQDEPLLPPRIALDRAPAQVRVMNLQGSVMGKTVKGAPYSGTEISESTQMLADGTRIHNETQTLVFRDSEGRVRRETGNEVTIWDPVVNATWALNTKSQTVRKLPLNVVYFSVKTGPNGETSSMRIGGGVTNAWRSVSDEKADAEAALDAKVKMEVETQMRMAGGPTLGYATADGGLMRGARAKEKANTESIGKRTIEGVSAEGTRAVSTIEAGAIGNDRPIQSVTERWYSPDLQTVMLTRTTDPRMGEDVFKLVNVNRAEPAAYLFQVPAGYQLIDQK